MSTISLYVFENGDGDEETFTTHDAVEAREYAQENELLVIERVFEYSESIPVDEWDFRPKKEEDDDG